jgi:predicted Zn finger-like uncharacterized protein
MTLSSKRLISSLTLNPEPLNLSPKMKISCPKCQKKYHINSAKIPAGVKTAKCKACGHPMPLKGKVPVKPAPGTPVIKGKTPARPSASRVVFNRSCLYCGQLHTLRRDKIPSGTVSIKCQSCGRPVALKLDETAEADLVHSLKKETPKTDTATPPAKTAAIPAPPPDVLTLTCSSCNKRYNIPLQKIPPTAKTFKCKACGHRIKLPVLELPPVQQRPAPEILPLSPGRSRKNMRLYAMAAGILLLVLVGIYAGFKMYKDRGLNQLTAGTRGQPAASSTLLEQEPFVALNLNLPLILKNIETGVDGDRKNLKFRTTMALVKSLKLKRLDLFLYAGPENQVLPVILARGSNPKRLEKIFKRQEGFTKYFKQQSSGKYRFKQETLEAADTYHFPDEPYQMTLLDKGAVFAPVSVSGAIAADKSLLLDTDLAGFARSIADPKDLARVAVRIPENLPRGWEKNIQKRLARMDNPQAAMIAGAGSRILAQLTDSLKPVQTLALGFRFTGQMGRAMSYAQQFRPGVDGNAVYQTLNSGDLDNVEVDGIIRTLLELFQDPRFQHTLGFADNRLSVEFNWLKDDDNAFLAALSTATIGPLFARETGLKPSPGAVAAEYREDPLLFTTVDGNDLKPKIPRIVKQSLFPGRYWNFGENYQMTLDLDPVAIPNAALAKLTYEVKSIRSPDGKDILRVAETNYKPTLNPGGTFPGRISLDVKNGTPPASLGTARIQFGLSMPDTLQIFEFKRGEEKGRRKKSGGIQVTLDRLEKDVADVTASGGKSLYLIAYDKTGRALVPRESISSAPSAATRFQGVIDTLKVVVAASVLEVSFEIEVDLNGGQELKLSHKPEIPKRIRYNHHPLTNYRNFSEPDLDNLMVAWREASENAWTDSLEIRLAQGPFSGHANWEVHFFGHDQPQFLTGNATQGTRNLSYTLEKGRLADVHAAFGVVQLNIQSDIKRLSFIKTDGGRPRTLKLPSGEPVTVSFDKNEISFGSGKAQIIQMAAFDSFGKRLKQSSFSTKKGRSRKIYFWGQPVRFEMDLSTKILEKKMEFDIKKRPLEEKAYLEYQKAVDDHRRIVSTLKSIDRARRTDRSYYGDDLAGLYYLYGDKTKQPMQLFSKDIARSDPAGQNRFGYKARPYRGYYFTVLSGVQARGVNQAYKRRSKKSKFTWKKGHVSTTALTRHPDLVAIPADPARPTFFLQWGQVFMKPLKGETLKYLPENYYEDGWVEAQFID